MIVKAFVEFRHETSCTKSFSHWRIQNVIQNGTLRGLFSFYWPILLQGFDRKSRENVRKTLFKGSFYNCQR